MFDVHADAMLEFARSHPVVEGDAAGKRFTIRNDVNVRARSCVTRIDVTGETAADTFSGEKPCELCCKIAAAKQEHSRKNSSGSPDMVALAKLRHEMLPAQDLRLKPPVAGRSLGSRGGIAGWAGI